MTDDNLSDLLGSMFGSMLYAMDNNHADFDPLFDVVNS